MKITIHKLPQKCAETFLSSQETFSWRNLKNDKMLFLGQCNVEAAARQGILGLSCSKVAGFEMGSNPKTFQGLYFLFSRELNLSIYFWVVSPWNKFEEKVQCEMELVSSQMYLCGLEFLQDSKLFMWSISFWLVQRLLWNSNLYLDQSKTSNSRSNGF